MNKKIVSFSIAVGSLVILSNCEWEWFKPKPIIEKKDETPPAALAPADRKAGAVAPQGEVLLSIEGKPVITVPQFEEYKNNLLESQPQLKQLLAFMPDAEREIFQSMANEKVLELWVSKNKIDQQADYQKDRRLGLEFLDRQLAIKYFQELYPKMNKVEATDADAKKWYDEKKDATPELLISRGGVNAKGISFDTEADAKSFLEKVTKPGADLEQLAKDQKLTVKEFKQVGPQSFDVDTEIREKLAGLEKFPTTELIKTKNKFWVVKAIGKEEQKYVPFEQVKDPIKQQLKMQKLFTDEIEKLKKEFKFTENKAFFESKKQEQEEQMKKMKAEMEKEQKAGKEKREKAKPAPSPVKGA
jgi:hypothetical protein